MIPSKIQQHFLTTRQVSDGDNCLLEGMLSCCGSHHFHIAVVGEAKRSMLSKMSLYPKNGRIRLEPSCIECGQTISVFDSDYDGYGSCEHTSATHERTKPVTCTKCQSNDFSITIRYEYPSVEELKELEISDVNNAVWVSLECR